MDTLIISCCAGKLERSAPALELYQNRAFKLLRGTSDIHDRFDIFILSAKYGLIPAHAIIEPYDQRLTDERARELTARREAPLWLRESRGDVYVYGGLRYRLVALHWVSLLEPRRELIEVIGRNRGDGDHYKALKELTA